MAVPATRAQTPKGSARVLLPIIATNVNGLFGSSWKTDFFVFNASDSFILFDYSHVCIALCTSGFSLRSQHGEDVSNFYTYPGVPATLVYVTEASRATVGFSLRVRDVSKQSDSWGAEVPVIGDESTFTRPFDLLNVPLAPRFRQMLRVYDVAATAPTVQRVPRLKISPLFGTGSFPSSASCASTWCAKSILLSSPSR